MVRNEEQAMIAVTGAIWSVLDNAFFAATVGRAIWHLRAVLKDSRPLVGRELFYEVLGVFAGYFIGIATVEVLVFQGLIPDGTAMSQGVVLVVSYLGPDGFQAMLDRWSNGRPRK